MPPKTYLSSGINLEAAASVKELFKPHIRSTFTPQVMGDIGAFGGLYRLNSYHHPVLVSGTDNVGTKLKLASWLNQFDTIGHDVVNQNVNDIITTGARPLFFLDYIAVDSLIPKQLESIVKGIAEACRLAGCALIGGETAQLPNVYVPGAFDLAGFVVGAVEQDSILDGSSVEQGDTLLALPASGLHTNGYSMVRQVFNLERNQSPLQTHYSELGRTLGDSLLEPHRSYWPILEPILPHIKAMAHITGGGLLENLGRVIPAGLSAHIDYNSWEPPPLFQIIQKQGGISKEEMHRVFNMGVGMVVMCAPERANEVFRVLPDTWVLGEIVPATSKH